MDIRQNLINTLKESKKESLIRIIDKYDLNLSEIHALVSSSASM